MFGECVPGAGTQEACAGQECGLDILGNNCGACPAGLGCAADLRCYELGANCCTEDALCALIEPGFINAGCACVSSDGLRYDGNICY